jgi:tetratricopeptide (TPR) repeat protein
MPPIRTLLLALVLALAASHATDAQTTNQAPGAPGVVDQAAQAKKYDACMKLAQRSPKAALKQAMEWEKSGGGDAARHCVAASYLGLKQYDDAAMELERIAQTLPQSQALLMAQLFAQAAEAWVLMEQPERALAAVNQGLKLNGKSLELLMFRARIYGNQQRYFEALDDLNAAYDLTSNRGTILILRAKAYRLLEQGELANDNIEMALKADPNDPDALLERGLQRAASGDRDGARSDWLRCIELAPESEAAADAQAGLAQLDVKTN